MIPQSIISDEEIEKVHANANFGSTTKRDVVNFSVLKAASGYWGGHTEIEIAREHGLLIRSRDRSRKPALTKKGKKYLWAAFGRVGI